MNNNFKIKKEDENKRLDLFLKEHYPDLSRSFLQKKIQNGEVKVNGEISAVHRFLRVGDVVELRIKNQELRIKNLEEEGKDGKEKLRNSPREIAFCISWGKEIEKLRNWKLDIIAETDDYVVINKPCGLIVHPSNPPLSPPLQGGEKEVVSHYLQGGRKEGFTLTDILLKRYPNIAGVGEAPERPGIVHRLDKEVSGIMIIAKTEEMFVHLKKQFQERTVKKEYIALVYGKVSQPNGVINFPIARSEKNGVKMAARSVNQGGREAITEFTVLKYLARWTLLSVKIKTGRTHQIRVHLNAYGHPVVGDKIYKPKKLKPCVKFGDRLFLHAWHLGFTDLAGEWKEFEAELPAEFARIMAD